MEVSTDGSEEDGKSNICPICHRGFNTVAGLRQHWTKSHSVEEINDIITNRSQQLSLPDDNSYSLNTNQARAIKNTFQIISTGTGNADGDLHRQFEIIEKDATGDCLFVSILEFLRRHSVIFPNVPNDTQDLRLMVVNYILKPTDGTCQSNFDRFQSHIIENLQNVIPSFSSSETTTETLKSEYAQYMSTPRKYGTTVELCAMAEIFKFGFYVIRGNDKDSYACYDYGSVSGASVHQPKEVVHLLFTGIVSDGHFKLLLPVNRSPDMVIPTGAYKVVKEYTSLGFTSIAPVDFNPSNVDPDESQTHTVDEVNAATHETSLEDFAVLLARCKRNIRVLKRVPRGARILAANKLAQCVDECLASPDLASNWKNLLTFAYTSLRVPVRVNNVSLSTSVKRNITKPELVFTKPAKKKTPISMSKRVECKIADGDIKGAVRILSSTDTLAPQNISTFEQLKTKHPAPSRPMSFPDPPDKTSNPLIVSEKEVFFSIKSFPNGSGSGIDGLLPQHLKDLTLPSTGEAGSRLLKSITALSNYMLSGNVQSDFIKIMYGASLCALDKKDGGVRPIAVGNTFRRLTSKLACASVRSEMASKFAPRQVGFGIKGGCEAAAHATRTFIKKNSHKTVVIVKIDFRNAFNEVDRDVFLTEMKLHCPAIFPYLWQCYSAPSLLFYGDFILLSHNGAQQGDPCGPLIFSSAIQFVINALVSEFVIFYLDDGTIGGATENVLKDFKTVIEECAKIGLHINPTKCELFFCSEVDQDIARQFDQMSPGICIVNEFTLLGTAITDNAFGKVFNKKIYELKLLFERLRELDNYHIAFYILKNCFAIPKLVFLLRTTPTWSHAEIIDQMDNEIKSTLETLTNSFLEHDRWTFASLPIRSGGTGIRKVRDTALPAFLSSVNAVSSLVSTMLHLPTLNIEEIANYEDSLNAWYSQQPDRAIPETPALQNHWDKIVVDRLMNSLHFDRDEDKARVLALTKPESGAWLHALPSKSIGTLLDNNAFRIIMGLRLGLDICSPHICICGSRVEKNGHHGLKCKKSAGRHARHMELNLIIKRALSSADVPSKLEPLGLARNDGKRVDGMTLIPWSKGSPLIWDATCTDTFAPSNIKFSKREAGRAAEDKARRKVKKYEELIDQNYLFVPFAVETMGPWSHEAVGFFNVLSKMLTLKTNEPRAKSFLMQRLSMAIQRGNAAAVMGTFRENEKMGEVFYLL